MAQNKPTHEDANVLVAKSASYLNDMEKEIQASTGKKAKPKGSDGSVSSQTISSVNLMNCSIHRLTNYIASIKPGDNTAASTTSMTTHNIEGFHSISHMRHHGLWKNLQHYKDFGRIIQESIKRTTSWSTNDHTQPSSYHHETQKT